MQNVTPLAVLLFFRVPALGLGSLSLLSDAVQRRDLESWLGRYGLVGTACWSVSRLLLGASFHH